MKKQSLLLLVLTLILSVWTGFALAEDATTVVYSKSAIILSVGKSTTVRPAVKPYVANKQGVTYKSSDESIATVTSRGTVKGISAGECTITATSNYDPAVSAMLSVKIVIPVIKMNVTAPGKTVFINETLPLSIEYLPQDASMPSATFASSRESIAYVSPDGVITGIARGSAKITITSADGNTTTSFTVTVAQPPESIAIAPATVEAARERKVQLKATVSPSTTYDKSVLWTSADESIATVSAKGQVTILAAGQTIITATSQSKPEIQATVTVRGFELAESITFSSTQYSVRIGESLQTSVSILPANTTNPSVTYKTGNARTATVDANGLVTGVRGGKTTLTVYTADGSKKRASATIEVTVPVTGVTYKNKDIRVGSGNYGTFTATLEPSNATNKSMTWASSDASIATVSGTTNRFRVTGHNWGRCTITGTTADGGHQVTIYVDIGSLRKAVTATDVRILNGKPYITLTNESDMNITQVRFLMLGYDKIHHPIAMSTVGDVYTLEGSYNYDLSPNEDTQHGAFTFYNKSDYPNLEVLQFVITGWSSDTGYYDHNGQLQKHYNISEDQWEWITYPKGTEIVSLAK